MSTITLIQDGVTFGVNSGAIDTNFANLNADKAEVTTVLTKTNVTVYSPSSDYHPATKLYVDTAATAITAALDPNGYNTDAFARANHTGTQAATTIVEDTTHRFATDAEKTTWNAKEPAITKATGFNKAFGTVAGTSMEGSFRDSNKADKFVPASSGNLASLDVNGNLADSGFDGDTFALDAEKVPTGGATGQRLAKASATNNDVTWVNPSVDYRDIIAKVGASEIATAVWAGATIVHTPTVDSICTLPQTSTEALAAGFNFRLHNASTDKVITITLEGSDTVTSLAGNLIIQPGQTIFVQKIVAGSPNTWDIVGSLYATDAITFGGIYGKENVTAEAGGSSTTPTKIVTAWTADGPFNKTTVSESSGTITIVEPGTYKISSGMCFSGGSTDTVFCSIYKNSTAIGPIMERKLGTGGDVGSASIPPFHYVLAKDDIVSVYFWLDSGTDAVTFHQIGLILERVK
jgi:hypothetical protein